ncbi:alpha/beta hydrolase [Alloalcanivorax xenomutans]|uniref:alpha/beta hydrolase n=1 Tax=Alloalcanivorax xenomutans TaxID=1094342 RepID=UPI0006D85A78|nr:alpha/beta hydrolase [Alloalcanivorax xenomutans]
MRNHPSPTSGSPGYIHVIAPDRTYWKARLLNGLLRLVFKSRFGSSIDISTLRSQFHRLDQQASLERLRDVRQDSVNCNGVNAEWLSPKHNHKDRILLYIHGGAFVAYTRNTYATMVSSWCQSLKARALMVDYSLAPEHPFPAAFEECITAYRWLLDQGFNAGDIVIAGDSAGGNLAMTTLQNIQSQSLPLPSCAVLLSPFLDFTLSGASALDNARQDPVFTPGFAIGIRHFYARAEEITRPEVSPLFGDFSGLPPLLFQVGSTEMLLDDAVRAAAKAHDADVPVRLEIWKRLPHVFQMIDALPQAEAAADNIIDFIKQHTGWST